MNYTASVGDFFKSPKWMLNLLFAGVCVFIPIVGPIVIKGWLATGFWGREDAPPESFPEFDFNQFGKYLERGVWPFLVTLVSGLAVGIAISIVVVPLTMVMVSLLAPNNHSSAGGAIAVVLFLFSAAFYLVMAIGSMILLTPLTLRATLTQDFGPSFNFAFIKQFVALTWKESIIAALFLIAASFVLFCAGALILCIGMYFAVGVINFCGEHLHKQLYRLYLSRGGEPIPVSSKLRDLALPTIPPPLHRGTL